jgi:hypothetical protein
MFRWQRYKLFLVSLHISSLFCCFALCKDEFRVEILVKGNGCGERFALLAGETIERSGLALGKQVGYVGISEQLSCYLLEYRHTTLLVAASYDLSEELHGTLLAFRTLAAGAESAHRGIREDRKAFQ